MSLCVGIDGSGYVVEVAESFPACTEYALITPAQFAKITYWADVSQAVDPTLDPDAWLLYAAILGVFATAWGIKQIARLVLNR